MTVRAPGEECLTKTQEQSRQIHARLREQSGLPPTSTERSISEKNTLAESVRPERIKPVDAADRTAENNDSVYGNLVDVKV